MTLSSIECLFLEALFTFLQTPTSLISHQRKKKKLNLNDSPRLTRCDKQGNVDSIKSNGVGGLAIALQQVKQVCCLLLVDTFNESDAFFTFFFLHY